MAKRRKFADQFKGKVAMEALRGDKTSQEIAAKHQVQPNQVSEHVETPGCRRHGGCVCPWRQELHTKIGRLAVENDFLLEGLKR